MSEIIIKEEYIIVINTYHQLAEIEVDGPYVSREIAQNYWQEIIINCLKLNVHNLVVNVNFKNSLSMADTFEVCNLLSDILVANSFKIALVETNLLNEEINEFGKLVAINRGANVNYFNNKSEAKVWLQKSEKTQLIENFK